MISPKTVFWEVDAQADFMLPGGKFYVPGAEEIIPNLNRLVETVRQGRVFPTVLVCYRTGAWSRSRGKSELGPRAHNELKGEKS